MFTHAKLMSVPAALLVGSGCVVYTHDRVQDPAIYVEAPAEVLVVNAAPYVAAAEVGVFWDPGYHDDIWYFDALVDDADSPFDVVEVWGDVYDERTGAYVDSFPLYPTDDPYVWYAEYFGSTTRLDPFYRLYSVDIVAYDTIGDFGWTTVWAWTY